MSYYWIKQLHVATVVFTIAFFALRLQWALHRPALVKRRWVRRLAAGNDTLLLLAGISLAIWSRQYPLVADWLTAKLVALLVYILFGSMALTYARRRGARLIWGLLALASVAYIVSVAFTRSPAPWRWLGL